MPSCPGGFKKDGRGRKRCYSKEAKYEDRPEQVRNRVARNRARARAGLKVGDSREVDHVRPLARGGSNAKSNTRVVSRHFNRRRPNPAR